MKKNGERDREGDGKCGIGSKGETGGGEKREIERGKGGAN
jgi:hypothetical protein